MKQISSMELVGKLYEKVNELAKIECDFRFNAINSKPYKKKLKEIQKLAKVGIKTADD